MAINPKKEKIGITVSKDLADFIRREAKRLDVEPSVAAKIIIAREKEKRGES